MAVYHFNSKYLSRAGKTEKNAVRAASYCAGTKLSDLNTGDTYNYSKKSEVIFSEIQAPANSPEWVADRQRLWSEVEKKENRYDAKLMTQFEVSLPHELDEEQSKALMYDFVSRSLVKRGMIADWSIHWLIHNKHCHVNTTTREITGAGFGKKVREWEEKKTLFALRKEWAECVNKHLEMAGSDVRIDHRSFKEQGIDHKPTIHVGPERATNQDIVAERKRHNRKIRHRNQQRDRTIQAEENLLNAKVNVKSSVEQLEQIKFNESKRKNIKQRIVNSITKPVTKPAIETIIEASPSVVKSTSLAPADLFDNVLQTYFKAPTPSKPPEPPVAIEITCRDLRLPNGKIIYPKSIAALEKTISAWELSEAEAIKLKSDFWKVSSPDYYNYYLTNVFRVNAGKFDDGIFDKYNKKDLDNLKEIGLSPVEMIEQSLKGDKLKQSIGYYYKQVLSLVKAKSHLSPANISPFDLCFGYQNNQPIADIANKAITKNAMYSIPSELTDLMTSKTQAAHYDAIANYCSINGLSYSQTDKFMEIWWEQVTFHDYHMEVRRIALQNNKLMNLDMVPVEQIREQFDCRASSPRECLSNLCRGGGTGFNSTPGPLQPKNTPQPRTPWGTPKPGSGFTI